MAPFRRVLALLSLCAVPLLGCAHGDPLPARAARPGPPASVKDHPGFAVSNTEGIDVTEKREQEAPSVCILKCPTGQKCVLDSGIERCVAQ